jgi:hypothetical protein
VRARSVGNRERGTPRRAARGSGGRQTRARSRGGGMAKREALDAANEATGSGSCGT